MLLVVVLIEEFEPALVRLLLEDVTALGLVTVASELLVLLLLGRLLKDTAYMVVEELCEVGIADDEGSVLEEATSEEKMPT